MKHVSLHAVSDTLLFHDWTEARALWDRLLAIGPVQARVLMPDHVHMVAREPHPQRVRQAMAAWTRWRRRERGWKGLVWIPLEKAVIIPDLLHLERSIRYVHLNPCRGGLATDPLAWPMSTHRDALGLAVPLARPMEVDPFRFHTYVSSDPSVNPSGTAAPSGITSVKPCFEEIEQAVSAVARTPVHELRLHGPARALLIRALRVLTGLSTRKIAERVDLSHTAVRGIPREYNPEVAVVGRVLGDERNKALNDTDFRRDAKVRRYLQQQAAKRLERPV